MNGNRTVNHVTSEGGGTTLFVIWHKVCKVKCEVVRVLN
jgi:hypothetical protein